MNNQRVKLEKYKGVDLMYDKQNGVIYFSFEGKEREVKYVFEAQRIIDEPIWEECDLKGFFIDGTFSDHIGKAIAIRKNKKSNTPEWKYKGRYDLEYKIPNYHDNKKVYPLTKENSTIYKNWEQQRDVVFSEERKLKQIIEKLK